MESIPSFPSGFPLHELLDLTDEIFFAYDLQLKKITHLNAAFERVWNMTRESVLSNFSPVFSIIHPDDKFHVNDSFARMLKDGQSRQIEFRILLTEPESKQKWIRVNAYTSRKTGNQIIIGIASDITEDKDYRATLHKFSDKKNSILQILSHDLLGPLGNIDLSTSMLLEEDKLRSDASIIELINLIKRNSKKSVSMIRDLINDEFLQSSESSLQKKRVDLIKKVNNVIDQLQKSPRSLPQQRFKVTTSSVSLFINIDEAKFMQALSNLLSNALKFTPDHGTIDIIIEDLDKSVSVKVRDSGIGIPAHLQPFLFDKFTRARRPGINGEPTTGLGMSIIKTIVEWHNGRIWFESTEGKGTTFFIEVPKDS